MGRSSKTDAGGEQHLKEEKHHKHMEQLAQLGAVAAGAYALVCLCSWQYYYLAITLFHSQFVVLVSYLAS